MQARSLEFAAPAFTAAERSERLMRAIAGVLGRAAAAKFGVTIAEINDDPRWPTTAAIARAAVMYVLKTELEFTLEDVASLLGSDAKRVSRDVQRIAERRDEEQNLDHWLGELAAACSGEPS